MTLRSLILPGLVVLALGWAAPARATLVLSFNQPSYTTYVGQTVVAQIMLTQTAGGTPVTTANPLVGAAIQIGYDPSVVTLQAMSAGAAWDTFSWSSGTTTASMSLGSLIGAAPIPASGMILGSVTIRGVSGKTAALTLRTLSPGPSFVTALGNVVDPTNVATATAIVSVPEPSTASAILAGGSVLGAWGLRRRLRRAAA